MTIYVSWPGNPVAWRSRRSHHGNDHQFAEMVDGLKARFDNVEEVEWGATHVNPKDSDWLICHPDFDIAGRNIKTLRERFTNVGLVWNDPLYDYAWMHGKYDRHGYNGFDHAGMNYSEESPNGYALSNLDLITRARFTLCHANRLALKRWETGEDCSQMKALLEGTNFIPMLGPFNRNALFREVYQPNGRNKFLALAGADFRKQQQQVWSLFPTGGFWLKGVCWFDKTTYGHIVNDCAVAISPSLQEAEPYFGLESQSKGLMFMGGEDFWDGHGMEELIWRHDEDNSEKVKFLVSDSAARTEVYNRSMEAFFSDARHDWSFFLDRLEAEIRK